MKPELTQARLKELLHYDPETGHFTWLKTRNARTAPAGARAGATITPGYCQIKVDCRPYLAHRLAFLYMLGSFPAAEVDHINRIRSDNRWVNLRPATSRDNAGNKGLLRNNTSGHRGVSWHKVTGKWQVRGRCDGRGVQLGFFDSLEEAAEVSRKWREESFGEFAPA